MYNSILIPVSFDDSRNTLDAIDAARALSVDGTLITFLHVVEDLPGYYTRYLPDDAFRINRKKFQEDLDALSHKVPRSETALTNGHSGRDIVRWAHEHNVDCIVVASHQPEFSDILLGSTAHYIVRHAKCAVHVVR